MDDRPRNLKTMLSEAKDTSELMIDLAYAALYFGDRCGEWTLYSHFGSAKGLADLLWPARDAVAFEKNALAQRL